jgi:pimeloyl-ACP methyl ester carboxylesterase
MFHRFMAHSFAFARFAGVLLLVLLGACAVQSPLERSSSVETLAASRGWQKLRLPTDAFALTAYIPKTQIQSQRLTIYIEGDGLSWESRYKPSEDPTPLRATGFELALQHPGAAAYLARPCQFTAAADWGQCHVRWWTSHRFGEKVVQSASQAVDQLKANTKASRIVLVGYSGGGAIAALLAARRNDVDALVTVAGTLDHEWISSHHRTDRLLGSLNPADMTAQLQRVPQLHFSGSQDKVIPPEQARSFAWRFSPNAPIRIHEVPEYGHQCCWADGWPLLVKMLSDSSIIIKPAQ